MRPRTLSFRAGWAGARASARGLARSGNGGVLGSPRTSRRRKRILSRCGRAPRSAGAASRPSSYSPVLSSPAGGNSQPLPRLGSQNPAVWKKRELPELEDSWGQPPSVSCLSLSPRTAWAQEGGTRELGTEPAGGQTVEGDRRQMLGDPFPWPLVIGRELGRRLKTGAGS